jgi:hypothetical protein
MFVSTSNGQDESHVNIPSPRAPSIIALCFNCHTLDQWQDPGVLTRHGNTLGGLFGFISDQMPQSEPGSLYPEDYAGIVAYMLSLNGVPSGNQALPTTYQAMDRIRVTPHP